MALDSSKVRVAVTGAWYTAPVGTAAPASASAVLPAIWTDLGYLSDAGTTKSTTRSTSDIIAWQNAAKVRTVVTDSGVTFAFTLIETTAAGVGLFTGSTVDATGKVSVDPGKTGGRRSFVLDVIDGTKVRRVHIPEGEVTEVGDQTFTSGEAVGYELTISAYPSATIGGNSYVEFIPELASA
ncbi:hypothetical protein [Plantibacter sp. YIM 135249]|jgi:hypothetical protein|uniref:phage tail tube protein n=1 Tax=Plantibacter sp. YIM 135249 TaxID=3423918 RepID=UPI003D345AEA